MKWSFRIIQPISEEYLSVLKNIFSKSNHQFFHQDPEWLLISPDKLNVLIALDHSKNIVAYAALELKPFKTVHISFGPVLAHEEDAAGLITAMVKWLKQQGWWRLSIQLPAPSGEYTDLLLKQLRKEVSFRQSENFFNWKSWWLTIDKEPEELFKLFSSHHQKSVRQSLKRNISYQLITDPAKAAALAELHITMYKYRKLPLNEEKTRVMITTLHRFLIESKKGFMIGAELDGQLVGGVIIVFQGNSAYYFLGASTTQHKRNIPILYAAFFEIISHCWKSGIATLDFGGFDPTAKPGSQMHNINRFKTGFGGRLVDYPGQLVFDLNPLISRAIEKGIFLRNSFRKWRQRK